MRVVQASFERGNEDRLVPAHISPIRLLHRQIDRLASEDTFCVHPACLCVCRLASPSRRFLCLPFTHSVPLASLPPGTRAQGECVGSRCVLPSRSCTHTRHCLFPTPAHNKYPKQEEEQKARPDGFEVIRRLLQQRDTRAQPYASPLLPSSRQLPTPPFAMAELLPSPQQQRSAQECRAAARRGPLPHPW